ncbi:MAG: hypothetical protein LBQ57_03810 [Spirochaetales bacterium]|jgi:hypothetical protein|nr:hypothetical protein [Spirochaetales bacterium]
MKKTCLIVAVFLLAAAGLYAGGRGEDPFVNYRNQVTLSGTLQFANGFPMISADGKTYNLFAPRFAREAYTLKPGLALTVEGYLVQQGPRTQDRADDGPQAASESIFVQKVIIDGKTFEVNPGRSAGHDFAGGKGQWEGRKGAFCGNYREGGHRGFDRNYDRPGRDR